MALAAEPERLGTGPTTETTDRPRVQSPYWNPSNSGPLGDLPAADIRAVPPARAAAVQSKWTYFQLRSDLNNATRSAVLALESSADYKQARADQTAAWEAMSAARQTALSGLQTNAAYQAAESLRTQLTQQIQDLHQNPGIDSERIIAAAKVKLAYMSDNRKLETDALARDTSYQDARQRYIAASKRVHELNEANTLAIANDENLQSLRKSIAGARIAHLSTDAYLDSIIRARNIAVNYAEYYRDLDIYHGNVVTPWGYGDSYYPGGIRVVGY
ncbi:MAG: hypothetical protein H7144_11000 [Burkholderiales bacterium]|nr:hypothetical protein [Phycisphaerae bacterium]